MTDTIESIAMSTTAAVFQYLLPATVACYWSLGVVKLLLTSKDLLVACKGDKVSVYAATGVIGGILFAASVTPWCNLILLGYVVVVDLNAVRKRRQIRRHIAAEIKRTINDE